MKTKVLRKDLQDKSGEGKKKEQSLHQEDFPWFQGEHQQEEAAKEPLGHKTKDDPQPKDCWDDTDQEEDWEEEEDVEDKSQGEGSLTEEMEPPHQEGQSGKKLQKPSLLTKISKADKAF